MQRLLAVILFCLGAFCLAHAQTGNLDLGISKSVPSAAGLTWANLTSAFNSSCGFGNSCTISTTVPVTTGFVIAFVGGATDTTLTTLTICGSSMGTPVIGTVGGTGITAYIYAASITGGGSCTVSISGTGGAGFAAAMVALGTLSGFASSTATSTCSGSTTNSGGAGTVPCSTALTVPSSGIAISGASFNVNNTIPYAVMTVDAQQNSATPYGGAQAHYTTAGSLTPTAGGGVSTFATAAIVGATWH